MHLSEVPSLLARLLLIMSAFGCQTSERGADALQERREPQGIGRKLDEIALDCAVSAETCTGTARDASLCLTVGDDALMWMRGREPRGWGNNRCAALGALRETYCAIPSVPQTAQGVYCVPDPAAGECPTKSSCPVGGQATVCTAGRYLRQPLSGGMVLRGWGSNPCEARANLAGLACQMNLRPSGLEKIVCQEAKANMACPPDVQHCEKAFAPAVCKVQISSPFGQEYVLAMGTNTCHARYELDWRRCFEHNGLQVGDVSCERAKD